MWLAVTLAINREDQIAATEAKTALEEAQRERAKERQLNNLEWIPKYFVQVRYQLFFFNLIPSMIRQYKYLFLFYHLGFVAGKIYV